jgi:hypothetical protein
LFGAALFPGGAYDAFPFRTSCREACHDRTRLFDRTGRIGRPLFPPCFAGWSKWFHGTPVESVRGLVITKARTIATTSSPVHHSILHSTSTLWMGREIAPSGVRSNSLSLMVAQIMSPPCRRFFRGRCANRAPGEQAKKNQQRNDFHLFSSGRDPVFQERRQVRAVISPLKQAK